MLKARNKSAPKFEIHVNLDKQIWDGHLVAYWTEIDGEPVLAFDGGERADVSELADILMRRYGYVPTDRLDSEVESWIDLESEGVEIEVGWNDDVALYILGPQAELERLAVGLKARFEEEE